MLKKIGFWLGYRAPYIGLSILFFSFALVGSKSIENHIYFQYTAAFIGILQIASILKPNWLKFVCATDIISISWLMVWGWVVYVNLYPFRTGLFGVLITPAVAIFVAFGAPLRFRIYKPYRYLMSRTSFTPENLTLMYSDITRTIRS